MIEAEHLTKRYGTTQAVADLSFAVQPGVVTGFLGPNGAGKSTTMRLVLGLDHPTSGRVTVAGKAYATLPAPLREVGAVIEATGVHKGRKAYDHLLYLAQSNGIPRSRVDAVLELVGLSSVANRKVGGYSLGMSQRLGIAGALLGDPPVLLFDEPINGLDPQGILWVRNLLKTLAGEGRTVLVSSHLMNEMAVTASRLLIVGRGRLLADTSVEDLVAANSGLIVRVRTPDHGRLTPLLVQRGAKVEADGDGVMTVTGPDAPAIGELAAAEGIVLHELTPIRASLEEAFMKLTGEAAEYQALTQGVGNGVPIPFDGSGGVGSPPPASASPASAPPASAPPASASPTAAPAPSPPEVPW